MKTPTDQPDAMSTPVAAAPPEGLANANSQPLLQYKDLRDWIAQAERLGEIRTASGLSWQEDIGMATELLQHDETSPSVIFDKIAGSLPGSRVLVNFFAGKRQNMTLGFPLELTKPELSEAVRVNYMSQLKRIPPKFVDDGPIFENVMMGDEIDVTQFPTPIWHKQDGGRYVGTGSFNVTRDPEEGWVNCGTYRVMIHDKTSVGFYISPGKQGRIHRDKYAARGEPMPVAIVAGGDPMAFLMGGMEIPYGISEYEVVGGIRGEPVEVVRGRVTGLPIPANAEIVIEGFVEPGKVRSEGPFGEWTGYYGTESHAEPVMDIKAIYYRNNPILLGCPPQSPPDESTRYRSLTRSAMLREAIQKAGVPDVTGAWAHEVGGARLLLGVAIKQRYPGHARQAGHITCQCHLGAYAGRYVIVVDDDIDVSNLNELMWAVCTRSDPATSIDIIKNAWSTPLDPRIEPERRERKDFTNNRAIIDACRPWHWRDKFPKVNMPTLAEKRLARSKFGYLLAQGFRGARHNICQSG